MQAQDAVEYRRKAEECQAKAAKATDSVVTMAKSWEMLARQAEKDDKPG